MTLLISVVAAIGGTVSFSLLFGVPTRYYPYCGLIGGAGGGENRQFFRLCSGAGIRPPRPIKRAGDEVFSGITGPPPSNPPKDSSSPTCLPMAGTTRTAVVLELTMPIAASSAMMAEITSAGHTASTYWPICGEIRCSP